MARDAAFLSSRSALIVALVSLTCFSCLMSRYTPHARAPSLVVLSFPLLITTHFSSFTFFTFFTFSHFHASIQPPALQWTQMVRVTGIYNYVS